MADLWTNNEAFNKVIETIKAKHLGIQILSVRSWSMPLYEVKMQFVVEEDKTFNPIEHFILEMFCENEWCKEKIVDMLQLPPFMIEDILNQFQVYELLSGGDLLALTPKGKECYEKDRATHRVHRHQTYYMLPGCTRPYSLEQLTLSKEEEGEGCPYESFIEQWPARDLYKEWLVDCQPLNVTTQISEINRFVEVLEIWIYDEVQEKYYCRVWEPLSEGYVDALGEELTLNGKPVIEQIEMDEEYIYMQTQYQSSQGAQIKPNLWIERYEQDRSLQIEVVRGKAIKPVFMEAIAKTQKQLIIFSPWMSQKVIDEEMIKLFEAIVQRGGKIFLGWGISRKREEEDRIPEQALITRLEGIVDDSGQPAVHVCWIGNNHSKEVVVDDVLHMSGSFNFLSYRGDYLPRGESVTLVRQVECVQEAKQYWESVFQEVLEEYQEVDQKEIENRI